MLLKGEQLAAHLERELKAVYVVYGDEPLLVIEAADAIRTAARRKGFDEREVLTAISGFNWSQYCWLRVKLPAKAWLKASAFG